jgi:hypothetical protein
MSITALTGIVPEWYTPESQKESSTPARFKLKPLDSKQLVEIQGYHTPEGAIAPAGLYRAFEISVIEWENVNDSNGRALKCNRGNIKTIPIDIIAEAGAEVISVSFLGETDEKNL